MNVCMLAIILILIVTVIHQGKEIRDLERKTLEAFKIACTQLKKKGK